MMILHLHLTVLFLCIQFCWTHLTISPSSVRISTRNRVSFQCHFPSSPTISNYSLLIWRFQPSVSAEGAVMKDLVRCSSRAGCAQSTSSAEWTGLIASVDGELVIPHIQEQHHGVFQCHVLYAMHHSYAKTVLYVLNGPEEVQVSHLNPDSACVAGRQCHLQCSALNANPPPSFTWWIKRRQGRHSSLAVPLPFEADTVGGVVVEKDKEDNSRRPFGVARHNITFVAKEEDDGAEVGCVASNEVANSNGSFALLPVQYAPRAPVIEWEWMRVVEGDPLTLECSSIGNPPPEIAWFSPHGDVVAIGAPGDAPHSPPTNLSALPESTARFRMESVPVSLSGNWSCQAENIHGKSKTNFHLKVMYPPQVSVTPSLVVAEEGKSVSVRCEHSSLPLPRNVVWRHLRTPTMIFTSNSVLQLTNITRFQTGQYECTAENRMQRSKGRSGTKMNFLEPVVGRSSNFTRLVVKYAPKAPTILISPGATVLRGQRVRITCSLDATGPGVPLAAIRWLHNSSSPVASVGHDLIIISARFSHSGMFACFAINEVGESPRSITFLQVEGPPEIREPLSPPSATWQVHQGNISFPCSVYGKPRPRVTWLHNGHIVSVIPTVNQRILIRENVQSDSLGGMRVSNRLTFITPSSNKSRGLQREDTGEFTCEATNRWGSVRSVTRLIVQHAPEFEDQVTRVAVNVSSNTSAILSCNVVASPTAHIVWRDPSGHVVSSNSTSMRIQEEQRVFTPTNSAANVQLQLQHSSLTILTVNHSNVGVYQCEAINSLGSLQLNITLSHLSRPDAVSRVQLLSRTWNSLLLTWRGGFNGGLSQNFTLHIISVHGGENITRHISSYGGSYNVTGLLPNSTYHIMVYASNELGHSHITASSTIHTRTAEHDIPALHRLVLEPTLGELHYTFHPSMNASVATGRYCVRIEVGDVVNSSGDSHHLPVDVEWRLFRTCVLANLAPIRVSDVRLLRGEGLLRGIVCDLQRLDVCSEPRIAAPSPDESGVSTQTIVIVATVCAALIIFLLLILLYFALRRRPDGTHCWQSPRRSNYHHVLNATNGMKHSANSITTPSGGGGGQKITNGEMTGFFPANSTNSQLLQFPYPSLLCEEFSVSNSSHPATLSTPEKEELPSPKKESKSPTERAPPAPILRQSGNRPLTSRLGRSTTFGPCLTIPDSVELRVTSPGCDIGTTRPLTMIDTRHCNTPYLSSGDECSVTVNHMGSTTTRPASSIFVTHTSQKDPLGLSLLPPSLKNATVGVNGPCANGGGESTTQTFLSSNNHQQQHQRLIVTSSSESHYQQQPTQPNLTSVTTRQQHKAKVFYEVVV